MSKLDEQTGDTKNLAQDTFIKVVKRNLPSFICYLLSSGLLERDKMSDPEYVWMTMAKNWLTIEEDIGVIVRLDQQFVASARDAIDKERFEVAIVLIAIAVEHRLNDFYRAALEFRGILSTREITDAIRATNIRDKIGWFLTLVSSYEIYEETKKRIENLFDLRNQIVHYKLVPSQSFTDDVHGSHNVMKKKIAKIDFLDLLSIPDDLDSLLSEALEYARSDTHIDYALVMETTRIVREWLDEKEKAS